MKYMILRRADAFTEQESGPQPSAQLLEAMGTYHEKMHADGILRAAEGLHPSVKGARLKISKGKTEVIDGPFTETKELIAGFSMVELPSKQEAVDLVKRWPPLDGDVTLEIREVGCVGGCPGIEAEAAAAQAAKAAPALQPDARRYMVLLRSNGFSETEAIPDAGTMDALMAFNQAGVREGRILAGEGLRGSALGARVAFEGGKMSVIDGPFTEIKELIAGFWLIRANSLQDAIEWARRCPYPTAVDGEVEVEIRLVYEADEFDEFTPELRDAEERMRAQLLESGMQMTLAGAGGQA
ncbi:hypothetical protein D9O50_14250 [Oxalobacteraceae bacterium CAVE-383]|nr:hypothetical protein D9O50_14250 [Oxalobacteraceae bacterium CAVE-383]